MRQSYIFWIFPVSYRNTYRSRMQKNERIVINCNQMFHASTDCAASAFLNADFCCFSLYAAASPTDARSRICFIFFTIAQYLHCRRERMPPERPFVTFINQNGLLRLFCATRPCKGSGGRDRPHGRQKPRRNAVQRGFPISSLYSSASISFCRQSFTVLPTPYFSRRRKMPLLISA